MAATKLECCMCDLFIGALFFVMKNWEYSVQENIKNTHMEKYAPSLVEEKFLKQMINYSICMYVYIYIYICSKWSSIGYVNHVILCALFVLLITSCYVVVELGIFDDCLEEIFDRFFLSLI